MIDKNEVAARLTQAILRARPLDSIYHTSNISMSDISQCIRKTFYKMTKTPIDEGKQQEADIVNLVMSYGNQFETVIGNQLALAGFYRGKVRLGDPSVNTSGETDPCAIFESENIITECKGTNEQHYRKILELLKQGKDVSEVVDTYYTQLQGYLWAHPNPHILGMIIIGNRNMGYNDGMPPFINIPVERDIKWREKNYPRLNELNKGLKEREPPRREFESTSWQCRKACFYFNRCYGSSDSGAESNNQDPGILEQ